MWVHPHLQMPNKQHLALYRNTCQTHSMSEHVVRQMDFPGVAEPVMQDLGPN